MFKVERECAGLSPPSWLVSTGPSGKAKAKTTDALTSCIVLPRPRSFRARLMHKQSTTSRRFIRCAREPPVTFREGVTQAGNFSRLTAATLGSLVRDSLFAYPIYTGHAYSLLTCHRRPSGYPPHADAPHSRCQLPALAKIAKAAKYGLAIFCVTVI